MAGFCTRCGRPLPESGICPCTQQPQQPQQPQYQQPQAPKEPSAFGLAIKGLPQLWLSYCKDPIGTTRKAVEKHDFLSGILMAAVTYIAVFFATLVYALRLDSHFPAVAWLGASLLMPVAGFGLTLLATLVLTKVAKVPSDFKGMLASSGLGMTFPATLAAGSIVLLLVYPGLISLLGVASFAVWAVVTVGTLLQVAGLRGKAEPRNYPAVRCVLHRRLLCCERPARLVPARLLFLRHQRRSVRSRRSVRLTQKVRQALQGF